MLGLFSKYLLIGLSAMFLLAGAQQGLFNKQALKLAEAANCTPGAVDPNTWTLIEQWECQPGNPGVKAHKWVCFNDSGLPIDIQYTDGISDTDKCPINTPPAQPAVPAQPAASFPCESNPRLCGANETFCEKTGDNLSEFIFKHEGACHPENGEHDTNGCIYIFTPQAPVYHNNTCQVESAPAQPAQPAAPAQPAQKLTCYICDINRPDGDQRRVFGAANSFDSCNGVNNNEGNPSTDSSQSLCNQNTPPVCVPNGSCSAQPACGQTATGVDNCTNPCQVTAPACIPSCRPNGSCSVQTPTVCGQTLFGVDNCNNICVRQSVACPIPPQGGNITINPAPITNTFNPVNTFNPTNTVTNTTTNTINNPAPQVITAQAAPAVGNVGVGGTVYTQAVQYVPQTLPKTGLPELAWSALAFIPTGFGMRRFGKIKKALENHPSYIFEEREYKGDRD